MPIIFLVPLTPLIFWLLLLGFVFDDSPSYNRKPSWSERRALRKQEDARLKAKGEWPDRYWLYGFLFFPACAVLALAVVVTLHKLGVDGF